MMKAFLRTTALAAALVGLLALPAIAVEESFGEGDVGTVTKANLEKVLPTKPPYSPYAGRNFPTRPLFGDTHLHTSFSMDYAVGVLELTGALPRPGRGGRRAPSR